MKRFLSGIILFPIVAIIVIFGNKYLIDFVVSMVALMSVYEFYRAFKVSKKASPISWIGYLAAIMISIIHIIPNTLILKLIGAIIPISIFILFLYVIITNLKVSIKDIAITFFGICYIPLFLMFLSIIRNNLPNGNILVWFVFFSAWWTDIFAFLVGKKFGKHKFSKVSPNKSIEGCIGGTIGSVIMNMILAIVCNYFWNLGINYIVIFFICLLLSVIGQIGDLAASTIKRYTEVKDFSNLIPGHGGMLDRIDSVIFIAPFAYFLLMLI